MKMKIQIQIDLDFVIPDYRYFKIGTFLFEKNIDYFSEQGITTLVTAAGKSDHSDYLEKIGFTKSPATPNQYKLTI